MGRVDIFDCAENGLIGLCAGWSRSIDGKNVRVDKSRFLIDRRGHGEFDLTTFLLIQEGSLARDILVYRCSNREVIDKGALKVTLDSR